MTSASTTAYPHHGNKWRTTAKPFLPRAVILRIVPIDKGRLLTVEYRMFESRKLICACLAVIGCSHSRSPGQPARDAQAPQDTATDLVDSSTTRCIDPLDGGLAGGAVVDEPDGFETEGQSPLVAMDEQGNAIVVWSVGTGTTWRAQARRYTSGVGWSDAELLLEGGFATSVALRSGAALVALASLPGASTSAEIYAARFTPGGWSAVQIGVTSTGTRQDPSLAPPVAVLGQNAAMVTWIDRDSLQVAASIFDLSWQPEQLFGMPSGSPTASVTASGGFVVTSTQNSPGDALSTILESNSWDPAASRLPPVTVSQDASNVELAACIGGRTHALWNASGGLMHAELLSTGEWSTGETVIANDGVTNRYGQRMVTDLASNALAAWTNEPGAACNTTVAARYYIEGAGWQSTTPLSPSQAESHYQLGDLAMAPNGDAWALWRSGPCTAFDQEIWASHFDPTNGWTSPVQLDSTSTCTVNGGAVAMGGNRALAAWSRTGTGGIVVRWLE